MYPIRKRKPLMIIEQQSVYSCWKWKLMPSNDTDLPADYCVFQGVNTIYRSSKILPNKDDDTIDD